MDLLLKQRKIHGGFVKFCVNFAKIIKFALFIRNLCQIVEQVPSTKICPDQRKSSLRIGRIVAFTEQYTKKLSNQTQFTGLQSRFTTARELAKIWIMSLI